MSCYTFGNVCLGIRPTSQINKLLELIDGFNIVAVFKTRRYIKFVLRSNLAEHTLTFTGNFSEDEIDEKTMLGQ
jgi:hypothetical protein